MMNAQSRRSFIKTASLVAAMGAAGPLAHATDPALPVKRVVFVFMPGGVLPGYWNAKGCDRNFTFAPMSQPLEPIKQHLLFLNNLTMTSAGHGLSFNALGGSFGPNRATLDVQLGAQLSADNPFKQITLNAGTETDISVSKTLEGSQLALADPFKAYNILFKDLPLQQKGILDEGFKGNYAEVRNNFDTLSRLHSELAVLALARDKTNVVSLMLGSDQADFLVPIGDKSWPYHSIISARPSHEFVAARAYLTQKFTYLVQLLEATKDTQGDSLLAGTLVVMVSDMGDGSSHGPENAPFLLAGAKSYLKGHRLVDVNGFTHLDFLDTVNALLGGQGANYGNGPIAAILK